MRDAEWGARPETAEPGTCQSCMQPIWWVVTTAGNVMPLDAAPEPEGNIEMVRLGNEWRADVLAQVESLFDIQRLRWRSHFATCPHATTWRRQRDAGQHIH